MLFRSKANTPINQEGIDHYDDVINTILEYGMQPVVTIHHFDTPFLFVDEQYPERSYEALVNSDDTDLVRNAVHNVTAMWVYNGGFSHPEFIESYLYYSKVVCFPVRLPQLLLSQSPEAGTTSMVYHCRLRLGVQLQ